jgi:hypothetical protein
MVDPPQPAAAATADGDPPAAFIPEATNNHVADVGHAQVDHGGVATAGGGGRGVAAGREGRGGRVVAVGRGGRGGRGVVAARGGGGSRGTRTNRMNYSANEIAQMLEIIEDVVPISGAEWEVVETRHYAYYSDAGRTADQLRKKFNKLARTAVPTGSPNIPPNVAYAKRIRGLIIEKTEGGTGSVSEGFGLALGPDDLVELEGELDDEVSSINQGDDAALGAMYGEDGENGANPEEEDGAQDTTANVGGAAAGAAPPVLQAAQDTTANVGGAAAGAAPQSFKLCLVRDQAVEELLHQLP